MENVNNVTDSLIIVSSTSVECGCNGCNLSAILLAVAICALSLVLITLIIVWGYNSRHEREIAAFRESRRRMI